MFTAGRSFRIGGSERQDSHPCERRKDGTPGKGDGKTAERFLSAQADPSAGSGWGRESRPAPFEMTVGCAGAGHAGLVEIERESAWSVRNDGGDLGRECIGRKQVLDRRGGDF